MIKIIDNSTKKNCNCKGQKPCKECTNGIYKEPNYIMVATTPEGQKIAFQTDNIK